MGLGKKEQIKIFVTGCSDYRMKKAGWILKS